jgi:uncharacterized protein YbbC (DUF1343 family)
MEKLFESWVEDWNINNLEAVLRPLIFKPTFHKYKDEKCWGFQLHPGENYHSLLYSVKLLREINEKCIDFAWRKGPYEAGSELSAIELLAGDEAILNFLYGDSEIETLVTKFSKSETAWIKQVQPFILYPDPIFSPKYKHLIQMN